MVPQPTEPRAIDCGCFWQFWMVHRRPSFEMPPVLHVFDGFLTGMKVKNVACINDGSQISFDLMERQLSIDLLVLLALQPLESNKQRSLRVISLNFSASLVFS